MRRDQHITVSRRNSQTDLVVIQDGDTTAEWLDLTDVSGEDIVWQVAEGTVNDNFNESDVIYEAPPEDISVVTWGETNAEWPERFEVPEDEQTEEQQEQSGPVYEIAPPPDSTLIVRVRVPPEVTAEWLASPIDPDTGERTPELVRECKVISPDDFALQRTAISVVQGNVTVLPSTDDGTGQA